MVNTEDTNAADSENTASAYDEILTESSESHDNDCKTDQNESEFLQECENMLKKMNQEYRERRDELKHIIKLHKIEIKNAEKNKKVKRTKKKQTGFTKSEVVPDGIAKLIGLNKGSVMPRTEVTKEIYKVIQERNLYYTKDKRVLRADNEIMKLFGLSKNVNKCTDPKDKKGFNFYNIQSYIAKCYTEQNNKQTTVIITKKQNQTSRKLNHT